jgi:hypothetical protein
MSHAELSMDMENEDSAGNNKQNLTINRINLSKAGQ